MDSTSSHLTNDSNGFWECTFCTLHNKNSVIFCECCKSPRKYTERSPKKSKQTDTSRARRKQDEKIQNNRKQSETDENPTQLFTLSSNPASSTAQDNRTRFSNRTNHRVFLDFKKLNSFEIESIPSVLGVAFRPLEAPREALGTPWPTPAYFLHARGL